MKRWIAISLKKFAAGSLAVLLVLSSLTGCQQVFLSKEAFEDAHSGINLAPSKLEDNVPITGPLCAMIKAPSTVSYPERTPLHYTLQQAIAQALETGTVSGRNVSGVVGLLQPSGAGAPSTNGNGATPINNNDSIRVLSLNPAVANAAVEANLARFDAVFLSGVNWVTTDELQQGLSTFNNGQSANYWMGIAKPLATGGTAFMSWQTSYNNLTTPPVGVFGTVNPLYSTKVSFGLEQPLLQGAGVEINQLLPRFSQFLGLSLNQINTGVASAINNHQSATTLFDRGAEGILITRIRADQSRAHFENNVNIMLVNVEVAYWTLYNKYGQLYSFEENLRVMHKVWQDNHHKFKEGGLKPKDYYQVLGQYEEFRAERIRALDEVIEAERNLRSILGLPLDDGTRLVPITPPTLAEMKPNWDHCMQDALNARPDLAWARQQLQVHQYNLAVQKNLLKPNLTAYGRWEPAGFGSSLTGDETFIDGTGTPRHTNAYRSLASGNFTDFAFGLNLTMPLGYRAEMAQVRAARLQISMMYHVLRDWENQVVFQIGKEYQELDHWYKRIEAHRSERLAYGQGLKKRIDEYRAGTTTIGGSDKEGPFPFLEAQRRYAAALVKEYQAIAEYNNTLARLEWAKGTIQRYDNVHIGEGPLPQCAQVRAVEHEKERARSLVCRQRPDSLTQPGRMVAAKESDLLSDEHPTLTLPAVTVTPLNETSKAPSGPAMETPSVGPTLLPAGRAGASKDGVKAEPSIFSRPREVNLPAAVPVDPPIDFRKSGPQTLPESLPMSLPPLPVPTGVTPMPNVPAALGQPASRNGSATVGAPSSGSAIQLPR